MRSSPNAQLVLYDLPTKNRLHAIRLLVAEIEEQIGEFKRTYINEYTQPMVSCCRLFSLSVTSIHTPLCT